MSQPEAELIPFELNQVEPFSEFRNQLAKMKDENSKAVFIYSSPAGNKAARSHIYTIRQVKANLEKSRKEAKQAALDYGRLVDSSAKELNAEFEAMIEVHEAPLREIEEKEKNRIAEHEEKLQFLRDVSDSQNDGITRDSSAIQELIDNVEKFVVNAKLEEFEKEAAHLKAYALSELKGYFDRAKKAEDEKAELERLRIEKEERDRKDREERIAKEASENAKREAEELAAKEKAESDRKAKEQEEAVKRAEQAKKDAEDRAVNAEKEAKEKAERELQQKLEAERLEAEKREADKKHHAKINNEAVSDLVEAGLTEANAKLAVTAIAQRKIKNIEIRY